MITPITSRIATNRSRASFTRITKSNHHHTRRQKLNPGGGRSPPSSWGGLERETLFMA